MGRWAPCSRHALLLHTWLPPCLPILVAKVLGQWILHSLGMTGAVIHGHLKTINSSLDIKGTYPYESLSSGCSNLFWCSCCYFLQKGSSGVSFIVCFLKFFINWIQTYTHTFLFHVYKSILKTIKQWHLTVT